MRYLSVCSGIESATAAWDGLGWEPFAFSEVDPFASAVLAHHYPSTPNWGDMTKFREWPDAAIDVLVGGTPCQSFSVAGLRKGLADPRGNLALVYLAIADRYRPEWVVWENVPGVLSSGGGRDFRCFLSGLAELGYGWAYRVLDAQYFGVAQRRRRVFVVGCLGGWQRATAVLFERASLSGHPAPRRTARKDATDIVRAGVAGSLGAHRSGGWGNDLDNHGAFIPEALNERTNLAPPISMCLTTNTRIDAESETLVPIGGAFDVADTLDTTAGDYSRTDGRHMVAHALRGEGFDASEDGTGRGVPLVPEVASTIGQRMRGQDDSLAFDARQSDVLLYGDKTGPLDTDGHSMAVAQPMTLAIRGRGESHQLEYRQDGTANALLTPNGGRGGIGVGAIQHAMQVRRLTPRECERLQGFPDDYTAIPYRGKPAADGPRYKALGNSMAVPVMRWIGQRIQQVEQIA